VNGQPASESEINRLVKEIESGSYQVHEERSEGRLHLYYIGFTSVRLFKVQSVEEKAMDSYYFFNDQLVKIVRQADQNRRRSVTAEIFFLSGESPAAWDETKRNYFANAARFLTRYRLF
jgi:hypothetical protein